MCRIVNKSAFVRNQNYKGGLKEYSKQMLEIGKLSKIVRRGSYLLVAWDVYDARKAVNQAPQGEKMRTAVVETTKIGTGLGVGAVAGWVVFTLATGGTGLVVLGAVAITGAVVAWGTSEGAGLLAGKAYDEVDSFVQSRK